MNGTELGRQGEVGEGTSIDFEEPVVITIQCDGDGWVMQVTIIFMAIIFIFDWMTITCNCTGNDRNLIMI